MTKKTWLDEVQERCDKATTEPWEFQDSMYLSEIRISPIMDEDHQVHVTESEYRSTLEFIAHARQDVPELVRRLRKVQEFINEVSLPPDKDSDLVSLLNYYQHGAKRLLDELEYYGRVQKKI